MEGLKFDLEHLFYIFICIGVSILGSLANVLSNLKDVKITFFSMFAQVIVTIFFVIMIYIVWTLIELPIQYGFILSGLVGFYGKAFFEKFLKDKTGIDVKELDDKK